MELPNGLKIISQLFDAGGGLVITLYGVETIRDCVAYYFTFMDLCHIDVFSVMETEELKKFLAEQMEK